MSADDAWLLVSRSQGQSKKIPFIDTPIEVFRSAVSPTSGPSDSIASRVARNEGTDPLMMVSGTFGRVWLYEWYMRIAGADYTFWTLGITRMLSKPVLTADAYPEQDGARPIVIGLGAVEAFRPYPMSPVESWQPLQLELNDQVNLRLDHLKQCVSPPSLVKRGADVDLNAIQKRGAGGLGMRAKIGCHTFRATGITAYLEAGGTLENAQAMAAHESPRTTKLYDRTGDEITLDEVERITI